MHKGGLRVNIEIILYCYQIFIFLPTISKVYFPRLIIPAVIVAGMHTGLP